MTAKTEETRPLLDVSNLSITFGGLRAVDGFNLKIRKGELYGLIGPNGAGKTTVFNMLTGVYRPNEGVILLDGRDITGHKTVEINHDGIARTFQNIRLFQDMPVIDNVKVGLQNQYHYSIASSIFHLGAYHRVEKEFDDAAMDLLKIFGLEKFRDYKAANLPYGQQRKLEIARAMATKPKLLLLDEPAAGMNPNETQELMDTIELIREKFGITILLIEHDMKLVSGICEQVTVLNFGRILRQGITKEVLKDPRLSRPTSESERGKKLCHFLKSMTCMFTTASSRR